MKILLIFSLNSDVSKHSVYCFRDITTIFDWEYNIIGIPNGMKINKLSEILQDVQYDIVLAINFHRHHFNTIFPESMPFISWVQDSDFARTITVDKFNTAKCDYMIGYTTTLPVGLRKDRLINMPMLIPEEYYNQHLTRDKSLSFVSNRGNSPRDFARDVICRIFTIDYHLLDRFISELEDEYQSGLRYCSPSEFRVRELQTSSIANWLDGASDYICDTFTETYMFWGINERIYRQTIIDWMIEIGADINLYGSGWDSQDKYKPFVRGGFINYRYETPHVFQTSFKSLHLNATEGYHNRIIESSLCGARCIMRGKEQSIGREVIDNEKFFGEQMMMVYDIMTTCINKAPAIEDKFVEKFDFKNLCDTFTDKNSLRSLLS